LTTRLDEVTMARLAEMAKRTGVSVSMQARILLVAALRDGKEAK
jgi:hypothetical protein